MIENAYEAWRNQCIAIWFLASGAWFCFWVAGKMAILFVEKK